MIRLFTILYKTDFKKVPSGLELFNEITSRFNAAAAACATCRTRGRLGFHGDYGRCLVDYDGGVQENSVGVARVKCAACGHTHALLPDALVPHKSYCVLFILQAIKEYAHTHAASAICAKYGIAASTLYAWRDRYLAHAALDLGAIVEEAILGGSRWLSPAPDICRTEAPRDFFVRFGFSFLQYSRNAETTSLSSA